jgi:chaperonin GroES
MSENRKSFSIPLDFNIKGKYYSHAVSTLGIRVLIPKPNSIALSGGQVMKLSLKPLGDRLVVEPIEQEEVTAGGIVLPETAKEKPQQGKVLAVGPGARDDDGKRIAMDVKVGDKVLYAKYAGTEFKMDGKKLLILRESDLLAILD